MPRQTHNASFYRRTRTRFFGFFRAWALRIICLTWRKQLIGLAELDQRLLADEKMILVFWHGKYFSLLPLLSHRDACVFTSLSLRGDAIRDILERFGLRSVQLTDHGQEQSLELMRETLRHCNVAAIAVDGPLGPQHHVHHGAIQLASELGHVLVPVAVAGRPRRVIRQRWDQFEMPLFFARVCLVIGDTLVVPAGLSQGDYHEWEMRVHDALESIGAQAEHCVTPDALNQPPTDSRD